MAAERGAVMMMGSGFLPKALEFWRLIRVVLLQDMRSRFGASYLGYVIAIMWPLFHLTIISGAYVLRTQIAPVGDSPAIFIATGAMPYILCLYPARNMSLLIAQNRQLLNIPIIKPLHLIICRSILETLTVCIVMAIALLTLYLFNVDIMPLDMSDAASAAAASIILGIGLGVLNVVLFALLGMPWQVAFIFMMIGLYLSAGIFVPISAMPEYLQEITVYNPIRNIVEWMRSAYFLSYDTATIRKGLIFWYAGICFALGIIGERVLRGKFFR